MRTITLLAFLAVLAWSETVSQREFAADLWRDAMHELSTLDFPGVR
jgi:hypothetical protein